LSYHRICNIQVSKAPIIGRLAKQIGSIFVHKRAKPAANQDKAHPEPKSAGGVTSAILNAAKEKKRMHLCIFPEGTTTNGEQILKFRSGAFVPMLPVAPFLFRFEGFRRGADYDPHYTTVGVLGFAFGLMSQPSLGFSVEHLPVQYPSGKAPSCLVCGRGLQGFDAEDENRGRFDKRMCALIFLFQNQLLPTCIFVEMFAVYATDGETPREYANRIQTLISKKGNFPVVSQTYADKKALEDTISDGHLSLSALYEIQRLSLSRKDVT